MDKVKSPRVKGFSNNGRNWPAQTGFDTTYKTVEIVDTVKKTGEGPDDYVIVKKVVVSEQPIREVIDADKDSVGVYNIINQVMRTGDTSLLPMDDGKCNVDMVGAPETLMEVKEMGEATSKAFASLPDDLTKGQALKQFLDTLTQEQFDAFFKAMSDRSTGKDESVNE